MSIQLIVGAGETGATERIKFDRCSELGESVEIEALLMRSGDDPSTTKSNRWIHCLQRGVEHLPIRLMMDPQNLSSRQLSFLSEKHKAARDSNQRFDAELRISLSSGFSMSIQLKRAFPSSIEFIRVNESGGQQFVVELSFEEMEASNWSPEFLRNFSVEDSGKNLASLSLYSYQTSVRSIQDQWQSGGNSIKVDVEDSTDFLEISPRYIDASFDFESDHHFIEDSAKNRVSGAPDRKFFQEQSNQGLSYLRGRKKRRDHVLLSFQLFEGLVPSGQSKGNPLDLQAYVESVFIPCFFNLPQKERVEKRRLYRVHRTPDAREDDPISRDQGEHVDEVYPQSHSFRKIPRSIRSPGTQEVELSGIREELGLPEHFYDEAQPPKSQVSDLAKLYQAPVKIRTADDEWFYGVITSFDVTYSFFDKDGSPLKAHIQLQVSGLNYFNLKSLSGGR